MGHCIVKTTYNETTSQSIIKADIMEEARREGDAGGLYEPIELLNLTFPTYEDADAYIETNDRKYRNFGVKYKTDLKLTSKAKKLEEQLNKVNKDIYSLRNYNRWEKMKSAYYSCKECGSKLSVHHLAKVNKSSCPVCCKSFPSIESVSNKLKLARDKEEKLNKELIEEKQKCKSGSVNWLIKYEYHC